MSEEIQELFERAAKACVAAVNCLKTAFEALCKIITQICKAVSELWVCTPLSYIIPAAAAEMATATGFYYSKAKAENKIKLMKSNGIKPREENFGDINSNY